MSARFERISGQQHTRSVALLLASIAAPAGLVATGPNSILATGVTLIISSACLTAAWVCSTRHSNCTIPTLDLSPKRR
jgi:hypothetical protein